MLKKILKKGLCILSMSFIFTGSLMSVPLRAAEPEDNALLKAGPANTLRIGTFNIAAGKKPNVTTLRELTDQYNLEVVGLQEIDVNTGRNPYNMLEAFAVNNYTSNYFSKAIDFSGGEYGIGTVSRYPLNQTSTTFVDTTGANEQRVFQRSVITRDGKDIAFYNVHLSWETQAIREKQFAQLKAALKADTTEYKIVVGDFNADQYYSEFYTFLEEMDLANGYDGKWHETFNGKDPTMKHNAIDNILVSRNLKLNQIENVATKLSDHNLFWAEVELLDQKAVSYQWLKAMISEYQNTDTSSYSESSANAFKAALTAAQAGVGQAASQEKADDLTKALIQAHKNLSQKPDASGKTMRIGTFNIAAGKKPDVKTLRELTDQYNLEVVGLQEIDVNTGRNPYNMLEAFAVNNYTSNYFSKAIDFSGGAYGIGTVSRYPLNQTSTTFVDTTGANEKRVFQRSVITRDGKDIAFYNVHLSWETQAIREKQFAQLKAALAADTMEYKIVVGDFNADQYYSEFYTFLEEMDLANGYDGKWHETFNGKDSTMKHNAIDNILVSRNLKLNQIQNVATKLSDHNLFWAEVEFLDQKAVSYQWLKAMILEYQNTDTSSYSAESDNAFKAALAAAQAGVGKSATQAEVNTLAEAVINTAAALTADKNDGDKPGNTEDGTKPGNADGGTKPGNTEDGTKPGNGDGGTKPGNTEDGTKPGNTEDGTKPGNTEDGTKPGNTEDGTKPGNTDGGTKPGNSDGGTKPGNSDGGMKPGTNNGGTNKPGNIGATAKPGSHNGSPKTGDSSNWMIWAILIIASAAAMIVTGIQRKRKRL